MKLVVELDPVSWGRLQGGEPVVLEAPVDGVVVRRADDDTRLDAVCRHVEVISPLVASVSGLPDDGRTNLRVWLKPERRTDVRGI